MMLLVVKFLFIPSFVLVVFGLGFFWCVKHCFKLFSFFIKV